MNRLTEHEIKAFMRVLKPIRMRLTLKYGNKALYNWRQTRLQRQRRSVFSMVDD